MLYCVVVSFSVYQILKEVDPEQEAEQQKAVAATASDAPGGGVPSGDVLLGIQKDGLKKYVTSHHPTINATYSGLFDSNLISRVCCMK